MSTSGVYQQVYQLLKRHFDDGVDESSRTRLALLVTGMIGAKSASPARVANALHTLGLRDAKAESLERQIRRLENDPEIEAATCFHPFARWRLLYGKPQRLLLIVDPTLQKERVVMVSVAIWYRGRALPLGWMTWTANVPLEGKRFWERVEELLNLVAGLLPVGVPVICMADRAFGTPAFIDLLIQHGWHYIVRAQGQTLCRDCTGRERSLKSLVPAPGSRAKLAGQVFKKSGWRTASVVAHWDGRYASPLCLVSDLPPEWNLLALYRRRYPIEAMFRDYKSAGWRWEQGQVKDLRHLERLLVGMALATWIALFVGTQVAQEILARAPSGKRHTRPWEAKFSLFTLGLNRLHEWMADTGKVHPIWQLSDWDAPNWATQVRAHHAHAFIFACYANFAAF